MPRFIILALLIPCAASARNTASREFPWAKSLREAHVEDFFVCGDANVQPTKASLKSHFLLGEGKTGLLLTELVPMSDYFAVLNKEHLEEAKQILRDRFQAAHLWRVTRDGETKDLGAPVEIRIPFVATVKDCMEGATTSLGNDCSSRSAEIKQVCCQEKFLGPSLKWVEGKQEFRLFYSPDPSVRLRVTGEKKHRFCNVQKSMAL